MKVMEGRGVDGKEWCKQLLSGRGIPSLMALVEPATDPTKPMRRDFVLDKNGPFEALSQMNDVRQTQTNKNFYWSDSSLSAD